MCGLVISNLPPRNPAFTGREPLLARLRRQLTVDGGSGGPVAVLAGALFGLGGVGKTQLTLEYAHRYGADYDLIWWIPSEDPVAIPAMLARLAVRLGLASMGDQEDLAAAALTPSAGIELLELCAFPAPEAIPSLGQVLRDQGDVAGGRACLERAQTILHAAIGDSRATRRLEGL